MFDVSGLDDDQLRNFLVQISLEWEHRFGVIPHILSAISEYDAAKLVGGSLRIGKGRDKGFTPVTKGFDFRKCEIAYQVKARRPGPNKRVRRVPKAKNYDWSKFIWILYDCNYRMKKASEFDADAYRKLFETKPRLSPNDMRKGRRIYP